MQKVEYARLKKEWEDENLPKPAPPPPPPRKRVARETAEQRAARLAAEREHALMLQRRAEEKARLPGIVESRPVRSISN